VTVAVEVSEAPTRLVELIAMAVAGDEVVIVRDGRPVARLVGVAADLEVDRVPGSARGLFVVPEDFDAPLADFGEYR
jgi:prevent-host-death family protein